VVCKIDIDIIIKAVREKNRVYFQAKYRLGCYSILVSNQRTHAKEVYAYCDILKINTSKLVYNTYRVSGKKRNNVRKTSY